MQMDLSMTWSRSGISTDKLHARGPVGLEGLTSQKFVIKGQGQLRSN